MRILLVKTSSLGDVIHNLPVVSDLARALPEATLDWCVEESFADIPRLHPAVGEVIPVAIRRWRKSLLQRATWREIGDFRKRIARTPYDVILDTQGLIKSALITRQAHGRRLGYAAEVAREPLAARFYDETFVIPPNAHAVERNRWLASAAFDTPLDLPLRRDAVQETHQQILHDDHRVDGRAPVFFAVKRGCFLVHERQIQRRLQFSEEVSLGH